MPLYEYRCTQCGHRVEKIEKVSGPHLKNCPQCNGKVERLPAAPAIQFKGSGWYVTDYARKTSGADSSGEGTGEASEKAGAKEAKEAKEAKNAKDAKDAKEAKDSAPAKAAKKPHTGRKEK